MPPRCPNRRDMPVSHAKLVWGFILCGACGQVLLSNYDKFRFCDRFTMHSFSQMRLLQLFQLEQRTIHHPAQWYPMHEPRLRVDWGLTARSRRAYYGPHGMGSSPARPHVLGTQPAFSPSRVLNLPGTLHEAPLRFAPGSFSFEGGEAGK